MVKSREGGSMSRGSDEVLESRGERECTSRAQLSAAAAHEIKNPLDSILNLLHLVEAEAILTDKGRHYLDLVREEVCQVSQIANQSLDPQKPTLVADRINLNELLEGVLEFYKRRFDSSGISVQTRYSSDVQLRVHSSKLRQVLTNLLLNAADAMPEGGKIQARVARAHEWNGQKRTGVRVTIADNGSGIAPDVISRIFQQRFTTKPAGHGIGLSWVHEFVQSQGGVVHFRSSTQPDRHGTVFTFFLPSA
jgi:two-component system, NtrC family, sensor kinase